MSLHSDTKAAEVEAQFDAALDRMAASDPGAAIPLLRRALELDPAHEGATHALIRSLQDAGHLDDALVAVRKRIEQAPDDVLAHTRLSILLQHRGDVPAAEAAAARAKILGWKLQLERGEPGGEDDSLGGAAE